MCRPKGYGFGTCFGLKMGTVPDFNYFGLQLRLKMGEVRQRVLENYLFWSEIGSGFAGTRRHTNIKKFRGVFHPSDLTDFRADYRKSSVSLFVRSDVIRSRLWCKKETEEKNFFLSMMRREIAPKKNKKFPVAESNVLEVKVRVF